MPTAPISVDSDTFVTAADGFFEVDGLVCDVIAAAAVGAAWGDAMAGCDSSGAAWARDYDAAARAALQAGAALADTLGHVATLLSTSGGNHAGAEDSSVPGGPPSYPGSGGGPGASSVIPSTPPSADGTPGDTPPGWFLVSHLLTSTWPNGHQDQLRAVGGTWATAGAALSDAADRLSGPIGDISALTSDEVDAAVTTCCDVQRSVRALSNACSTLGFACRDYAEHLDAAHTAVVVELVELVAEAAVIEAVGAVTAVPSAGSSEVGAQELVAARATLSATRIAATLARLEEVVNALATIAREAITGIAGVIATNAAVQALGVGSAVGRIAPIATAVPAEARPDWPVLSDMLRRATTQKGMFGMGTATREQTDAMGMAWVGPGATLARDGKTWVSADKLRQYRPPTWKPKEGKIQANFERREIPQGTWLHNGHVDVQG